MLRNSEGTRRGAEGTRSNAEGCGGTRRIRVLKELTIIYYSKIYEEFSGTFNF